MIIYGLAILGYVFNAIIIILLIGLVVGGIWEVVATYWMIIVACLAAAGGILLAAIFVSLKSMPRTVASHRPTMWNDLAVKQAEIVMCPHQTTCRAECKLLANEAPIPDFIGTNYAGLLIVGTNPGPSKSGLSEDADKMRRTLADDLAKDRTGAKLTSLSAFLSLSMLKWKSTLTNSKWRGLLNYQVETIAFVNLIKCRTTKAVSDPMKVSRSVAERCYHTHTRPLLEFLEPTQIVAQWKGASSALQQLDIERFAGTIPNFNGKRDLADAAKSKDIAPVFEAFRERLKQERKARSHKSESAL